MLSFSKRDIKTEPSLKKIPSMGAQSLRYELHISENEIIVSNKQDTDNLLLIDRKNLGSKFIKASTLGSYKVEKELPIYGIYGRVEINNITFLIAISKAEIVATIGKDKVFKVESIKFLTINREQYKNFDYESCWDKLERIKNFLKTGFYFSYNYRLQAEFLGELNFSPKNLMSDFNSNPFIWNFRPLKNLAVNRESTLYKQDTSKNIIDHNIQLYSQEHKIISKEKFSKDSSNNFSHFFFPVIQGFVGSIEMGAIKMILISRRSTIMGGTRYNSRGSDNTGNVANFVQTEQLVFINEKIYSFTQIRGSLPFYWEQQKGLINPRPEIHQRKDVNVELCQKHIKLVLNTRFEKLVFFNLLSRKKPDEDLLSKYTVLLLEDISKHKDFSDKIYYEHIDFHSITKQADFSNVDKHIYNIYNLNNMSSNLFEFEELMDCYAQKQKQTVLARTNCLDCLDRTNACQTKFGFYALYKILVSENSGILQYFGGDFAYEPLRVFESGITPFFEGMRKLWADNGDSISKIYTGTGATTSSVTRKGEKSGLTSFFDHKLKTLSRFYLNNFDDDFKQEIIDILLHKKTSSIRQSSILASQFESIQKQEMSKISIITLFSCKNNGNISISQKSIEEIFEKSKETDFIVFITRLDRPKNIQLVSENYIVYDSFNDLFKSLFRQLNEFQLVEQATESKFEISLFASTKNPKSLSFFKSDKASISPLGQSIGARSSFIISNVGIELFSLKLEQSTFGSTNAKSLEKVFEKYIDKDYDLVFVAGYIEDSELDLESLNKGYELALQEVRKGASDGKFSSHLMLFCSKNVVKMGKAPLYAPLAVNDSQMSDDITVNAHSFIISRIK
jgi:hypothetical protein